MVTKDFSHKKKYLFNTIFLASLIKIFEKKNYKPVILVRILYRIVMHKIKNIGKIKRNFFILNKFLNGAIIIKIKPAKLLIKNRG